MSLISVKLQRKTRAADDICRLEFVDEQGRELPRFSAGSHVDLHLPGCLVRQYSLCNASSENHRYVVAVLRDPASRGGSAAVHDLLREGDVVRISEPRNHFELVPAREVLLFAGGIGITPILCMAQRLVHTDTRFELHYSARAPERAAFLEEIRMAEFADRVRFHFGTGAATPRPDLREILGEPKPDKHLFVCGPLAYMEWVMDAARDAGWSAGNVHREHFAASEVDTSADGEFQVRMASSGVVVSVAKDQTISEALAGAGIDVPMSCEQGVCGTCLTRVLEGEIDHRDMFLSDEERARNDQFTPCVSRAKEGCRLLVIDL